jgi:plasmid stabilization system protein ParE
MPNPPDVVVRFNKKAQNDISEITEYYLSLAGPEVARKNVRQILLKCRWLAENPMIGDQIAGFDEKVRVWYTLHKRFKIYFRRTTRNNIRILRIRGSSQRPLKPPDL